ncbi:MAG: hypothetical protein F6K39_27275, partial [Okeania sp. SIO3B3]|nr:hypothetical protein [Okeania sp. SIO3B3]
MSSNSENRFIRTAHNRAEDFAACVAHEYGCLPSCRDTRAWELYKLFVHGAGLPNNPPEKETSREDLRDIA